jgi:hypothetical protein
MMLVASISAGARASGFGLSDLGIGEYNAAPQEPLAAPRDNQDKIGKTVSARTISPKLQTTEPALRLQQVEELFLWVTKIVPNIKTV